MTRSITPAIPFLLFAAAVHAQTDCRTPLRTPCATIRFQQSQWQWLSNGKFEMSSYSAEQVFAVRRDGSTASLTRKQEYKKPFGDPVRSAGQTTLYLAPEDQVVRIDHDQKTISRGAPMMAQDRPFRYSQDGDRTCTSGIRHWGPHFWLRGADKVAGVGVIKWVGSNSGGGYTELYLAPSLDCRPLKTRIVRKTLWLVTVFSNTTEATSVELGEPKTEVFAVPEGYRDIEDPRKKLLEERARPEE